MITVSLLPGEASPQAVVMTLDDGRRFISLKLGPDVTILGPGVDGECAVYARAVAEALIEAADAIDRSALALVVS